MCVSDVPAAGAVTALAVPSICLNFQVNAFGSAFGNLN